ncbi:hypothetical protein GA0115252_13591, partial [Streptomyces sp. DfronAA-171]
MRDGFGGQRVENGGEAGEDPGGVERVEAEQPDRRARGASDALVEARGSRVGGAEPGGTRGEAEDDGLVETARVP